MAAVVSPSAPVVVLVDLVILPDLNEALGKVPQCYCPWDHVILESACIFSSAHSSFICIMQFIGYYVR